MQEFYKRHRFALIVSGMWLLVVWGFVLAADLYFGRPLNLAAWAGDWDGGWYQSIVTGGYYPEIPTQQENLAFFPLYPALVWLLSKITQLPVVWAGMVVSSLSFAAALLILYQYVRQRWAVSVARWTILLLAFNPFSFYFGMIYTEALFVLFVVATLWYTYKKQWWLAALMAGLGSATRSVGIALGMMVICSVIVDRLKTGPLFTTLRFAQRSTPLKVGKRQRAVDKGLVLSALPRMKMGWQVLGIFSSEFTSGRKDTIPDRTPSKTNTLSLLQLPLLVLLSFSGLILFSLYLWQHTGDPFAYKTVQAFWPGRGFSSLVNDIVYLFEHKTINMQYVLVTVWYVSAIVAFIGLGLLIRMREYLLSVMAGIALSLPMAFGTAASMNRYSLVAAPIFIAYAAYIVKLPRWASVGIITLSLAGLGAAIFLIVDPRHIFVG